MLLTEAPLNPKAPFPNGAFQAKNLGPFILGVPAIRISVFWCLSLGSPACSKHSDCKFGAVGLVERVTEMKALRL